MNKRIIFAILGVVAVAIALSILIYKKGTLADRPCTLKGNDKIASKLYAEADRLVNEGKMVEARNIYRKMLAECPGSNLVSEARAKLEDLNIKILFSPIPTQDSTFYEVAAGDTLTKIAKNFGTTIDLIMKSNALSTTVIRPGMKLKISKAKYSMLVDKSQNILILKADGEVFKTYTVATGTDNSTPIGTYQIKEKLIEPTWHKAGAIIPPGSPDNILGMRWLGLTLEHYGIHGTADDSSLGKQTTAGCIRMSDKDVQELYSIVPVGTEIAIID